MKNTNNKKGLITVIANLKGGSGKSTVAFNLGLWLQKKGQPVVAYDLDPQCTLTDVAEVRREEGYAPPLVVYQQRDNLREQLQIHPGQVLVDVGAANMAAMKDAIAVADRVVVPVPPSQPDVWATQRFLHIVEEATAGSHKPELLVFVNRADTHCAVRESDETEAVLGQLEGISLIPHRLYQRTIYRRSLSEGLAIHELSRRSKAVAEFDALAKALFPQTGGTKLNMH
ncbi:MAG: AAA family ATPase [Gammaproteobacteria bacterium]|nr:AAA family ATPase [Gammaproteobacteria bacterium]